MKRQNQRNKCNRIRRLIKANFHPGDLWVTLKYPKGARPTLAEVKRDKTKFLGGMRNAYRKAGQPFKWICRLEIGKRGSIHMHLVINRIRDSDTYIRRCWKPGGVSFTPLYEEGEYEQLAEYIAKELPPEILERTGGGGAKAYSCYSTSKNLVRPVPVRKKYRRRTVRRLVTEGPAPTPGYYIIRESITCGINPYTGMSYCRYTERKLEEGTERRRAP